jgi:putative peptidoglycan lipid II flippase
LEQKASETYSRKNAAADIIKKGSIIAIITLISRPIGFVREAVQAYLFGVTRPVDAFVVAFNFPELIQNLFFSGATSAFLIPVCTKYLDDDNEYSRLYSTFINIAIVLTIPLSVFFYIFSTPITRFIIAPGFLVPAELEMTRILFLIMIPVVAFHTVLSIMKAFLNAKEHFAAPELSGILWSLCFIAAAFLFSDRFGVYSLAMGVTAGAFLQIVMQYPYLRRLNIRYRFVMDLGHPAISQAKNLLTGALIAASAIPVNSFVGRQLATTLPAGHVASLAYAFRIFILPASLFAVPVYTVLFSKISRLYHEKDWRGIFAHLDSSIVLLTITLIPSTILLCSMGDLCIKIIYQRGAFTPQATGLAAGVLSGYSIGLIFYALSITFVRAFNAMHDTKTPAVIAVASMALNALIAWCLLKPFASMGISLATSIASFFNFVVLFIIFKKKTHYRMSREAARDIIKSLGAGIILLVLIYITRYLYPGKVYLPLFIAAVLTLVIYGAFFHQYYSLLLKKR